MLKRKFDIRKELGPDGPMGAWPEFTPREQQIQMAEEVARAFENNAIAVIEAGTGTGKTLAYLLPALLSGKRTVVSTGLLNLQEQIYEKDLPFIRDFFGLKFTVALLKGRSNYVCLTKVHNLKNKRKTLFTDKKRQRAYEVFFSWAQSAVSGERKEIEAKIRKYFSWDSVASNADDCKGNRCERLKDCYVAKARKFAQNADVILINHHLFMSDLSLRIGQGNQILPDWQAAVVDEAHMLEEAATAHFGYSVSEAELGSLMTEIEKAAQIYAELDKYNDKIKEFIGECSLLSINLDPSNELNEAKLIYDDDESKINEQIEKYLQNLAEKAVILYEKIDRADQSQTDNEELAGLGKRLLKAAETFAFIGSHKDPNYVYQVEREDNKRQSLLLSAIPLDVGPYLRDELTNVADKPVIFTSATLSSQGNFKFFLKSLGIDEKAYCLSLPSPYDFANRTLLYVPKHLPSPVEDKGGFELAIVPEIQKLLLLSQGRALVLFTSTEVMKRTYQGLKGQVPFNLLVQGEMSKEEILKEFSSDVHSVLLATVSFWQGVDVAGESLSSVIIEKLPFPRPNLPINVVRKRLLDLVDAGAYFWKYCLPLAIIKLKQGVGRLIRREDDKGLLAILDNRIWFKSYSKSVFKSLPSSPKTALIDDVAKFFDDQMIVDKAWNFTVAPSSPPSKAPAEAAKNPAKGPGKPAKSPRLEPSIASTMGPATDSAYDPAMDLDLDLIIDQIMDQAAQSQAQDQALDQALSQAKSPTKD
jgi:ATP-dependent DNA helicase DinG